MPTEPDNNIEEQLKNWARKRRDDAGGAFELHPVTRRLLQDEVARNSPQASESPEGAVGWLALLRPRLAFALSVIAVMSIIGVVVLPSFFRAKSKGKALLAATEKEEMIVDQIGQLRSLNTDPEAKSIETDRRDEKNLVPRMTTPGLAVNQRIQAPASTPSSSKPDRFGEGTTLSETRDKSPPVSLELAQRQRGSESIDLASGAKAKESRLAKDEIDVATRVAVDENELKRQLAAGRPASQTASTESLAGADARFGARAQGTTVETPAAAPAVVLAESTKSIDLGVVDGAAVAPVQRQPASPALTPAGEARSRVAVENSTLALNYQKTQPAGPVQTPETAGKVDPLASANAYGFFDRMGGNSTQRFNQTVRYRRNFNSPPMPNVLTSFQLEQTGRQLRIVDADGSVYEGAFNPPEVAIEEALLRVVTEEDTSKKNVAVRSSEVQGQQLKEDAGATIDQAAAFRVVGTNRTLNQMVVFTGNVLSISNSLPAGVSGRYQQTEALLLRQTGESSQATSNTSQQLVPRVQGQVVLGAGERIEIDATPAGP